MPFSAGCLEIYRKRERRAEKRVGGFGGIEAWSSWALALSVASLGARLAD